MKTDPVCGMEVDESTPWKAKRDGRTEYFCSNHRFRRLIAGTIETTVGAARRTILRKSLAKVLTSAMQPHGQIVFREHFRLRAVKL
jgi:hypothetical protein